MDDNYEVIVNDNEIHYDNKMNNHSMIMDDNE